MTNLRKRLRSSVKEKQRHQQTLEGCEMEYSHFQVSPALASSFFSPAACSPWLPSVPEAAMRVVSLPQFPASMQRLSRHKICRDRANHSPLVKLLSASQKY